MRLLCGVLAVVVAVVLMVGCGGGDEATAGKDAECAQAGAEPQGKRHEKPREAWISVNRFIGPETVGIVMAQERGYFDDVGLEMTITSAAAPDGPIGYVEDEIVDFGLAQQPELVMAVDEGSPVVAVGALVPRPTAAMIWLEKSGIGGIADLEGKTIAIPGLSSQEAFLENTLARAGLTLEDVEVRRVGYKLVPALVDGRADAIFGGTWNLDGAALEALGLEPVVTRVKSLGIPAYEEIVVVAREDLASQDPRLVRDFMSAVARGNAAAIENPNQAIQLIRDSGEADRTVSRKETEAGVEATLPLLAETDCMNVDRAGELIDWMDEEGLIQRELSTSDLFTNRYPVDREE